jgi:hypothetical protein
MCPHNFSVRSELGAEATDYKEVSIHSAREHEQLHHGPAKRRHGIKSGGRCLGLGGRGLCDYFRVSLGGGHRGGGGRGDILGSRDIVHAWICGEQRIKYENIMGKCEKNLIVDTKNAETIMHIPARMKSIVLSVCLQPCPALRALYEASARSSATER